MAPSYRQTHNELVPSFATLESNQLSTHHPADASHLFWLLCPFRRQLIDTATCMLETLNHRRQPHVACWEASLVLGSPQPDADYSSVVMLTAAALEAMQLAHEGMADIVACLLDWMGVLHREWREVEACVQRSEQHSGSLKGQELLGVSDGLGAVVAVRSLVAAWVGCLVMSAC